MVLIQLELLRLFLDIEHNRHSPIRDRLRRMVDGAPFCKLQRILFLFRIDKIRHLLPNLLPVRDFAKA